MAMSVRIQLEFRKIAEPSTTRKKPTRLVTWSVTGKSMRRLNTKALKLRMVMAA